MASDNGQFEPDNSADFSDETIRRFLLGDLRPSEQPAFEHWLLSDHDLARRVHLAELELADDYAYGHLSDAERELVAERFLSSADREQQVSVSQSLRAQFAPAPVSGSSAVTYFKRLRSVLRVAQPAWRFAFTALILILLVGTVWVVVKKEPRIKEAFTPRFLRRAPNPNLPIESHHPTNISTPEHQTIPSPMPVHDDPGPILPVSVSVALTPSGSPDSGNTPSVNLPKGDQDIVRLQLALKPDQTGAYRAEILTIEGSSVFSVAALKPAGSGTEIDFDVPAQLLKTGDYQIKLVRAVNETTEDETKYYFRVLP